MRFVLRRVRAGEWLLGLAGLLLVIDVFALPWFGLRGQLAGTAASLGRPVNADGWNSLTVLGPLSLIVGALGAVAWWLQATRASPALPVCVTIIDLALSFVLVIALIIRVLLDPPAAFVVAGAGNALEAKSGAYAALVLAVLAFAGAYTSLRRDGVAARDAPAAIETLRIARRGAAGAR